MSLPFYLASQSPRRRELLTQLGYTFEIVTADIPEIPAAGVVHLVFERSGEGRAA